MDEAKTPEIIKNAGSNIVEQGGAMMQVSTGFSTAVAVQKPRNRMAIVKMCEEEAAIAGDEFYYGWTVKNKDGSKSLVEGPGVGLAQAAARNWGNCAVMMGVEEFPDHYIFTPTFVDLETGFNLQRAFRQNKGQDIGKFDKDRAEDIKFQIGQSKATRNVILNSLPNWLINKMMAVAKQNIIEKIQKEGLDSAKSRVLAFFARYDIDVARIEAKIKKVAARWNAEDIALLSGAMKTLADGAESAEELFPPLEEKKLEDTVKEKKIDKRGAGDPPHVDILETCEHWKATRDCAGCPEKITDPVKNCQIIKDWRNATVKDEAKDGKLV